MKRLTLYTKSGCTACTKARQYLLAAGIHYAERDIFKHPLTEAELRMVTGDRPLRDIFSFRSPSARERGLTDVLAPDSVLLSHMLEEPRLIRRPLLAGGPELVIGYDTARLQALSQLQEA